MRLIPTLFAFPILIAFACAPAVADDTEPANKDWVIKPFGITGDDGTVLTARRVFQYGAKVLLEVKVSDDTCQLWCSDGTTSKLVTQADGSPVSGEDVSVHQAGTTLLVETRKDKVFSYGVLDGTKTTAIVDPAGEPVTRYNAFYTRGGILFGHMWPSKEEDGAPLSVLEGNVLRPITDPEGNVITCRHDSVVVQPDGRKLLRASSFTDGKPATHRKYWLEGAKAVPVTPINAPEDWGDRARGTTCVYFKDHTLVAAYGEESGAAWSYRNGEYEPIVGADGKAISHRSITPQLTGGNCYLFAWDRTDDKERYNKGYIYIVDGSKATLLKTPEGYFFGSAMLYDQLGFAILDVHVGSSPDTYWRLEGEKLMPILTPTGKIVRGTGGLELWGTPNHKLLRFGMDSGDFWGELEGTTVTPLCRAEFDLLGVDNPVQELDGELFCVSGDPDERSLSIVRDGEAKKMKLSDGKPFKCVYITTAQAGSKLYVAMVDKDKACRSYIVEREK